MTHKRKGGDSRPKKPKARPGCVMIWENEQWREVTLGHLGSIYGDGEWYLPTRITEDDWQ